MSAIVTHLWSSTLVLLVAVLIARFVPLTARTRYAVLLGGLLKFAIPSISLRALGIDFSSQTAGSISMQWLGKGLAIGATLPQPPSRWPQVLMVIWVVPALALAAAWAIARWRLVSSALRTSVPASQREHAALAAARRQLGLRMSVDVTRSPICEAPAVVRIIRPVVILPDGGCDTLDDAELESLLRHECAHVDRRDNLLGLAESAIISAFWFHPLMWIAQRALATAREEACDERAASFCDAIDIYVSALSKICRAVLAPRLAGVSCMASAHLKERLNHIMRYELLGRRALSHRLIVTVVAVSVLAVTVAGGLPAASTSDAHDPYKLNFFVRPGARPDTLTFYGRVVEVGTDQLLAQPNITFKRGSNASVRTTADQREIQIDISDTGSKVRAVMRVSVDGVAQQQATYFAVPQTDRPRNSRYTGEPISMNLRDADLQDVLKRFAQLTGLEIQYSPALQGKVTIELQDIPWDEAFDMILRDQKLTWYMQGKTVVIKPSV
jgi:beta-lactamase regulating signal transducer with metallopeptidase domain